MPNMKQVPVNVNVHVGTMKALAQQCLEDSARWFGDSHVPDSLVHHTLCLAGEVGEFANVVKKIDRGSLSFDDPAVQAALKSEYADILTYMLNIAGILSLDPEAVYIQKREINEERFTKQRKEREARNG